MWKRRRRRLEDIVIARVLSLARSHVAMGKMRLVFAGNGAPSANMEVIELQARVESRRWSREK